MNAWLNEMKIPTLVLGIFMGVLTIARAHADYFFDIQSEMTQASSPTTDHSPGLACSLACDQPLDLGDVLVFVEDE